MADPEARELFEQAWRRARAHELTEEQLQGIIGRLKKLGAREPDESERRDIESKARVLASVFEVVEDEESDAETAAIRNTELVRQAETIAGQAAPIFKPDAETPQERAARRQRIDDALGAVSELFFQGTREQQQVLQELVDTLRWARDSIDGSAAPT
jgi:hypothetical protein